MRSNYMKSVLAVCLVFILLIAMAPAAFAADDDPAVQMGVNNSLFASLELAGKSHANSSYYTVGELKSWTDTLDLSHMPVYDISGLENCINITELDLSDNIGGLASLAPFDGVPMPSLEKLDLSNTNIWDFPDDLKMNGLKVINLSSTLLGYRLYKLRNLPSLEELDITNCSISLLWDLGSGFTSLKKLVMSYNQVSDLTPVPYGLETLVADHNSISDLTPLAGVGLHDLVLDDNAISDLTPLMGMYSLANLSVCRNYLDLTPGSADQTKLDTLATYGFSTLNYTPQTQFTIHYNAAPYTNPADTGSVYYGASVPLPTTVAGMPGNKKLLGWDTDGSGSQDHAGGSTVALTWPVLPIPSNAVTFKAYYGDNTPPLSADSSLTGLTASQPMTPAFEPATLSYAISLPATADHVTLTATPAYGAYCTIDGAAGPSRDIAVGPGETKAVPIAVTAQNGVNTSTYTVTVTRAKLDTACKLTGIGLAPSAATLSPAFSPAATAYTVTLPSNVGSVTITPAKPEKATMTIGGAANPTATVSLGYGETKTVEIAVTAENKTDKTTYRLTVKRAKPDASKLMSLGCSAGSLSPAFDPYKTGYTLTLPKNTGAVTLKPVKAASSSKLYINGKLASSKTFKLAAGKIVKVTVKVVPASGTACTYTVTIKR